jgi:RimJ/RimL family protein N-acetyltransferase
MFTRRYITYPSRVTTFSLPLLQPKLKEHLIGLTPEDKYRRFYIPATESTIDKYLASITLENGNDAVFVVYDDTGSNVVGMCHVGVSGKDKCMTAELALSVSATHRNQHIGYDMLQRAMLHCNTLGINKIFMYCLASNVPMQRMARKLGMNVVTEYDESTGMVEMVEGRKSAALVEAMTADTIALYDLSMRQAVNAVGCVFATIVNPPSLFNTRLDIQEE